MRLPELWPNLQAPFVEVGDEIEVAGLHVPTYDATPWQLGNAGGFMAMAAIDVARV